MNGVYRRREKGSKPGEVGERYCDARMFCNGIDVILEFVYGAVSALTCAWGNGGAMINTRSFPSGYFVFITTSIEVLPQMKLYSSRWMP